jgi:hypothetical protein
MSWDVRDLRRNVLARRVLVIGEQFQQFSRHLPGGPDHHVSANGEVVYCAAGATPCAAATFAASSRQISSVPAHLKLANSFSLKILASRCAPVAF